MALATEAEPWMPDKDAASSKNGQILRTGTRVNLLLEPLGEVSIDCDSDVGTLLFSTQGGKRIYPAQATTAKKSGFYRPPVVLSSATVVSLKAKTPQVKEACINIKQADWRVVWRDSDDITLVDVANLHSNGSQIATWLAYDYPGLALDPPFQAPFAQKREYVHIDCNERTWAIVAGYDLDEKNIVTDSAMFPNADFLSPGKDDLTTIDVLCDPKKRAGLPAFVSRQKAPLPSDNDDLSTNPAVLGAIHALNIPRSPKILRRYIVDGIVQGKPENTVHKDNILAFDETSGLTRISEKSSGFHSEELSFKGFFDVASIGHFGNDKISEFITQIRFYGDWANMAIGSTFGYSAVRTLKAGFSASARESILASECRVEDEVLASTLLPALTGIAKKIACKRNIPVMNLDTIDHGYFLRDYGWYIQLKTDPNDFYWSDLKLLEAE